jgi:hypothetical protein
MKHIQKKTGNAIRKERLFLKTNKYLMLLFLKKRKKKKKEKKKTKKQGPINSLTSAVFSFTACLYVAGTFLKDSDDRTHS